MLKNDKKQPLSAFRSTVFPLYNNEIGRFLLMSALMACCLFAYTSVRIMKDGLFVMAPGSSAQSVAFLKSCVVLPSSMLFVFFYTLFSKSVSRRNTFVGLLGFFGLTFFVYAHLIYPYTSTLHMSEEAILALQEQYPRLKHFVAIAGNWSYVLFYTIADISGNTLLTFAFWNLANQVTKPEDSKRIYTAYGMYGNITGIVAAGVSGTVLDKLISSPTALIRTRLTIVSLTLLLGICIYLYMYNFVFSEKEREPHVELGVGKKKPKLSVMESFKLVFSSGYLLCIAVMVLCYGMSVNIVELTWKEYIKMSRGTQVGFISYFNDLYTVMGIVTFFTGMVGGRVAQKLGWLGSALGTPIVMTITGTAFYLFAIFSRAELVGDATAGSLWKACIALGMGDPILVAVIIGTIQNLLSKSTKYTFFDPSTQAVYIPLHDDLKNTGKAAVDIVGGRFGKSGGSTIQVLMALSTGLSQVALAPALFVIFLCIMVAWFVAVFTLNRLYTQRLLEQITTHKQ